MHADEMTDREKLNNINARFLFLKQVRICCDDPKCVDRWQCSSWILTPECFYIHLYCSNPLYVSVHVTLQHSILLFLFLFFFFSANILPYFTTFLCFICYTSLLLVVHSSIPCISLLFPFYYSFLQSFFFCLAVSPILPPSQPYNSRSFSLSVALPSLSHTPFPFFFLYRMGHKRLNMFHGL